MKFFNLVNVHGHARNENKKNILLFSLFSQIMNSNIPTLICGDFNYEPKDIDKIMVPNLVFTPFDGITHINPNNGELWCIDHVVHNNLCTVNNISIQGIDQQSKCIKTLMEKAKHDHGILSFQVTI